MNKYQVILAVGPPLGSEDYDVEADGHRMEAAPFNGAPPFIVFYRDVPIVLDPLAPAHAPEGAFPNACICGWEVPLGRPATRALDEHIAANTETLAPVLQMDGQALVFEDPAPTATAVNATATLEVFRAPLHALIAVKLLDDDEESDETEQPEVRS